MTTDHPVERRRPALPPWPDRRSWRRRVSNPPMPLKNPHDFGVGSGPLVRLPQDPNDGAAKTIAIERRQFLREDAAGAARTKAERQIFVRDLGQEVETLLQGLAGPIRAWPGRPKAERLAPPSSKSRFRGCVRNLPMNWPAPAGPGPGPSPAERRTAAETRTPRGRKLNAGRAEADKRLLNGRTGSPAVLAKAKEVFNKYRKELLKIIYVIWGLFPLSLYLFLIIRAQANPLINWGNPSTLSNLLFHVLRLSFGSVVSTNPRSLSLFFEQMKVFKDIYFLQFRLIVGCLLLILLYFSLKKFKTEIRNLLILLLLFTSFGVVLVLNFPIDEEMFFVNKVFFMPFTLILIISLAFTPIRNKFSKVLLSFIPLFLLFQNYSYNDRSREDYTQIYSMDVLKSITYNSILFSAKDFSTFPLLYYQKVEYFRPDITIYDWFGNVFTDIFNMKDFHLIPEFKRDNIREQITDKIRLETDKNVYYTFQRDTLDKTKSFGIVYSYNKALPDFNLNYLNFPILQTNNLNQLDYFEKNMISVYYFHLGFFYKQQKNLILSDKYFRISNDFGGNKAKQYVNLALNELRNKNFNAAITYLQSAINSDDKLDQAYFILGNIYFQQNNLTDAEKMYQKATQINPLNWPAFNTLAELYLKQKNEFRAKETYQQGLATGYSKLFNGLAILLIRENNISEAIDYLKKGINISPDDFFLYLNLSVALSKINHWAESGQYLEKAYQLNPDDKNVILNLALVNLKLNNLNKAKTLLNEGKNKFPEEKAFDMYLKEVFKQ